MEYLTNMYKMDPLLDSLEFEFTQNINSIIIFLAKFQNLKKLKLNGNNINDLPDNLSNLKCLEDLDLSNNIITRIDNVISGLKSLPKLKKLILRLKNKEEEEILIRELPNLDSYNNITINKSDAKQKKTTMLTAGLSSKLNPYQNTRNYMRNMERKEPNKEINDGNNFNLTKDDIDGVSDLFELIRELLKESSPENDKSLMDQFNNHIKHIKMDLNLKLKPDIPSNIALTQLNKARYSLYDICISKFIDYLSNIDGRLIGILSRIHESHNKIIKNFIDLVQNQDIQPLRSHINPSSNLNFETKDPRPPTPTAQPDNLQHIQLIKSLTHEKEELLIQIKELQSENHIYLDTIIRHSKGDKSAYQQLLHLPPSITQCDENIDNTTGKYNELVLKNTNRNLTLKQLKDVIEEIYISKQKADKKNKDNKLARETMEQHMYTFLNHKYGLKNITIEWATGIINGIRKFAHDDNDVAVFGKILRNECDEEFSIGQKQVKNTILELLSMHLKGKYPYKHNREIKEIVESKKAGYINKDEYEDIIGYMYNRDDVNSLMGRIKDFLKNQEIGNHSINFHEFQKIILDFQLKNHEIFLKPFLDIFQKIDNNKDGLINESEFSYLLKKMNLEKDPLEIKKLILKIDENYPSVITFSQCITLFTTEKILIENKFYSYLQFIQIN